MEMEKLIEKKLVNRVGLSSRVVVVGIIFSAVFFLLLIDLFKTYQSEISILVSAKSQVAAKQQSQIVSNISELPKTLAFYERMLKNNSDMRDVTKGLSPQKRKDKWNEMLTVKRAGFDASVVKIAITTSHKADSEQLAIKTARTLFDTSAFYYNIKKDVDLRIVDGPITRVYISNWFWLFIFSIIAGFSISGLLQYLLFESKKFSIKKPEFLKMGSFFEFKKNPNIPVEEELEMLNNLYKNQQAEQTFDFEQEQKEEFGNLEYEKKFQEMKKITKSLEPDKYPNFPEMPIAHKVEASAPANLPIADDSFFIQNEAPIELESAPSQSVESEQDSISSETREPTPEELKKRLNELLKGKI
ncbi:MAG TPA: hypothetical protein DEA89_03110 [Candidatus Moranbacteria bacterium]|nr:hypothetical protein [Candidatus Moranbacteria bacterium]HBI51055.1 hypothetical protein [Candidatus Moranbacteria bacterium]HBU10874.1 hypothetical protein [Candidatus Moranbacteria bacterium]HCO99665.1 hypothetical protein [Candidatus Moranbacteria bacterium]